MSVSKGWCLLCLFLMELLLLDMRARDGTSVHTKDFLSVNIEIPVYSSLKKAFWNGILKKKYKNLLFQFLEHKTPFSLLTREDTVRLMETVGKRILPILDFIRSTQLNVGIRWILCEHPRFLRVWKAERANIASVEFGVFVVVVVFSFVLFLRKKYRKSHLQNQTKAS